DGEPRATRCPGDEGRAAEQSAHAAPAVSPARAPARDSGTLQQKRADRPYERDRERQKVRRPDGEERTRHPSKEDRRAKEGVVAPALTGQSIHHAADRGRAQELRSTNRTAMRTDCDGTGDRAPR